MDFPKVSIVMVVYNGEASLKKAIESIQRQTYADFEFIIVNDGSTDKTGDILAKQIDTRFVIVTNEIKNGHTHSIDLADSTARGKYIARMNPEDVSHPHRLQLQVDYLEAHPEIDLVGCHSYRIDSKGMVIQGIPLSDAPYDSGKKLAWDRLFFNGGIMFRRSSVYGTHGHHADDLDAKRHDRLRAGCTHIEAACLAESLYYRRSVEKKVKERHVLAYGKCSAGTPSHTLEIDEYLPGSLTGAEPGRKPEALDNSYKSALEPCERDNVRYGQLRAAVMEYPEDGYALRAYFNEAVASNNLVHAKSTLESLLHHQPRYHSVRRLLIGVLLKLKDFQGAMHAIELLVAFSKPDSALINAALSVREQLGPRVIPDVIANTPRISLCMIIKNEAPFMGACLNSIKGLVDEIVVVDTGSSDRSDDIARIYGAHVYPYEWRNDFSDARNLSLRKAKGDWILILDADEIMAARDQTAITQLLKSQNDKTRAYAITTRNYTNLMTAMNWQENDGCYPKYEAGAGWFPTTKVRLFPNDNVIRFCYPVHELVDPAIREAGYEIDRCPAPIHHYGTVNEEKNLIKARHYFDLGYLKLEQFGKDRAALRELAVQAGQLEKWSEAIDLWQHLLTLTPDYGEALVNMAGAYWKLGKYEEGLAISRQAVRVEPDLKEGYYNLAINLMMSEQLEEASGILKNILRQHPSYLAAEFMLAVISSLNEDLGQGRILFNSIEKKMSREALEIAIGELLIRLSGSALDACKHKIVCAAGVSFGAVEERQPLI